MKMISVREVCFSRVSDGAIELTTKSEWKDAKFQQICRHKTQTQANMNYRIFAISIQPFLMKQLTKRNHTMEVRW